MMRENHDRHVQENLEELLLDLRGSSAPALSVYAEDDDSVTRVLHAFEGEAEWYVALSPLDQRSLTTEEVRAGLAGGELRPSMLVWRRGAPTWRELGSFAELHAVQSAEAHLAHVAEPPRRGLPEAAPPPERRAAPPPERRAAPSRARRAAVAPVELEPRQPLAAAQPFAAAQPVARPLPEAACAPSQLAARSAPVLSSAPALNDVAPAARDSLEPMVPPELDLDSLALEIGSLRTKRAVMAVSALAVAGVFVTLFAISSSSDDKVREAARQRAAAAAAGKLEAAKPEATPPEPASEDPAAEPPPQPRLRRPSRGVPREAAALVMGQDEREPGEQVTRRGGADDGRPRL